MLRSLDPRVFGTLDASSILADHENPRQVQNSDRLNMPSDFSDCCVLQRSPL